MRNAVRASGLSATVVHRQNHKQQPANPRITGEVLKQPEFARSDRIQCMNGRQTIFRMTRAMLMPSDTFILCPVIFPIPYPFDLIHMQVRSTNISSYLTNTSVGLIITGISEMVKTNTVSNATCLHNFKVEASF
jgi:hypothetical protein